MPIATKQSLEYLPPLYPGELIYSFMARIMHQRGWDIQTIQERMFDFSDCRTSNPVLTRRLDALASNLNSDLLTAEYLAKHHTLLPYYTAFRSPVKKKQILQSMISNRHYRQKTSNAGRNVARSGVLPIVPQFWRFCSTCHKIMFRDRGEAFWRRSHQIPIALYCIDHGIPLSISNVPFNTLSHYVHPNYDNCPPLSPSVLNEKAARHEELCWSMSYNAVALLTEDTCPNNKSRILSKLIQTLRTLGYERGNGQLWWQAINRSSADFLSKVGDIYPEIWKDGKMSETWLMQVLRSYKAASPEVVIMASHLIESLQASGKKEPFGDGPWICHNPLSSHRGKRMVRSMKKLHRYNDGDFAIFECCCGYVYSRRSYPDGKLSPPQRKRFGPSLYKLLKIAIDENLTPHQTAKIINVNPISLLKGMKREGFPIHWSKLPKGFSP